MIHGRTSNGAKDLILRGWLGPRGLKGFVQGSITTPIGDKQFWDGTVSSLTPTVDQATVAGAANPGKALPVTISTSGATVSPGSGGTAPYTYAWALVSDDGLGGTWSAVLPTSATSTFRASAVAPGVASDATFRCTVTDARGRTGTVDVTALVVNYGS
jgi:hypothetical protein